MAEFDFYLRFLLTALSETGQDLGQSRVRVAAAGELDHPADGIRIIRIGALKPIRQT